MEQEAINTLQQGGYTTMMGAEMLVRGSEQFSAMIKAKMHREKTEGKTDMSYMVKNSGTLEKVVIPKDKLKDFEKAAKENGLLYSEGDTIKYEFVRENIPKDRMNDFDKAAKNNGLDYSVAGNDKGVNIVNDGGIVMNNVTNSSISTHAAAPTEAVEYVEIVFRHEDIPRFDRAVEDAGIVVLEGSRESYILTQEDKAQAEATGEQPQANEQPTEQQPRPEPTEPKAAQEQTQGAEAPEFPDNGKHEFFKVDIDRADITRFEQAAKANGLETTAVPGKYKNEYLIVGEQGDLLKNTLDHLGVQRNIDHVSKDGLKAWTAAQPDKVKQMDASRAALGRMEPQLSAKAKSPEKKPSVIDRFKAAVPKAAKINAQNRAKNQSRGKGR